MKKIEVFLICLLLFSSFVKGQDERPTQAPAVKTFALQPDLIGAASNSVNLFTGDVALPLNLISLPGRGGLDVNVSISYSSNVQHIVGTWNLEAPAGILGLGWSMDLPKIVADHMNTGAREDDTYYLFQGGSSNRLVRTVSGSDAGGSYYAYELKTYQSWKIKYYYTNEKWEITNENGVRFIYGDKNSARSTLQYTVRWDNWIGNSAQTSGQSQMAHVWNLSEIVTLWNEKVTFEYENVEQYVGSSAGKKQTEASYLKQITDVHGRKVMFFYNAKDASYFMEPHTERSEPDAYQEFYEKKYLDHIDVLTEAGGKFLSVHFGYGNIDGGANTAKMTLTSIVQKNALGQSLPGLQFQYNPSGSTKGFLNKITYPTGATVSYNYTSRSVTRSNRQLTIAAPAGYAEPRTWIGEDYVVVSWRELNTSGNHTSSEKNVKLYVYQWVGEWKEKFLTDVSGISLDDGGSSDYLDYAKFEISVQSNFFALISNRGSSSQYVVEIFRKDEIARGEWSRYSSGSINFGDIYSGRRLTLVTGENFVIVGADAENTSSHSTHRWIFTRDGWIKSTVEAIDGYRIFYNGTNNYFITHNTGVPLSSPPTITFTYLTEDRKWIDRSLPSSITFGGLDRSYWYPNSSFCLTMADDNPEYVYRWNSTYTNFYRDSKDVNDNDLFGGRSDSSPVNIIGNSLVAINDGKSYFARFDGKYWYKSSVQAADNFYYYYPSYSEDLVVCPVPPNLGGDFDFNGIRREFDPNLLLWKADFTMSGVDRGERVYAGNDFYSYGKNYYYRQSDGSWNKTVTTLTSSPMARIGYPQFSVWTNVYPSVSIVDIKKFKNGVLLPPFYVGGSLLRQENRFKNYGIGYETIITRPSSFSDGSLATSLTLTRFIKNNLNGNLTDYPVTLITVNDGSQNQYISLDYNSSTAAVDASGVLAQYNEVTVMPGCNACQVSSTKPYGYTKTFFYNGLSSTELGIPSMQVDIRWTGMPYEVSVYDATNTKVSTTSTTYSNFSKTLYNSDNEKVEVAYFVRPTKATTTKDGITSITTKNYDNNTGLLVMSEAYDYNSKRGNTSPDKVVTRYKYFWEEYDPTRQLNILSPVIQTKVSIINSGIETVLNVSVTTWKTWSAVWVPHKSYHWKRTGSSDFNFVSWNGSAEPAGDWIKLNQIDVLDNVGNVLQTSTR